MIDNIGPDQAQREIQRMANEEEQDDFYADAYIEGRGLIEAFIKDYGKDAFETLVSESDREDLHANMELVRDCDHVCTSECRRSGCNCSCGEYHLPKLQ